MQIITAYNNYLKNRGLTEKACQMYDITWATDGRLIIPVKDFNNNLQFNKYRRNPYLTDGPKYTYDKGSKSSLFGAQFLPNNWLTKAVIVCEGELDAALITEHFYLTTGIVGVSSTGGCGTWKEEWNELLKDKRVYICYDTDGPGVMGAVKVHQRIPRSSLLFLPSKVKDITELYQRDPDKFHQEIHDMMHRQYNIPEEDRIPGESITDAVKKKLQSEWLSTVNELNRMKIENYWAKTILEHVNNLKSYKPTVRKKAVGVSNVGAAKAYKITEILKFVNNKAKCIWHKDDSPSLTYYPSNNTVYCFGCQKAGDSIDVYMQINNVSFKEAVTSLSCN